MWVLIDRKLFQRNRMHGEPFRCIYVTERCYRWFRLGIDARPGDKPLHEPLITYCQLHQHGHTSVQYQMINKVNLISQQGVFENVVYKMAAILFFIIAVVSMQRDTNVHIYMRVQNWHIMRWVILSVSLLSSDYHCHFTICTGFTVVQLGLVSILKFIWIIVRNASRLREISSVILNDVMWFVKVKRNLAKLWRNSKHVLITFFVCIVTVDGLALLCAKASTDTVMTKSGSVYIRDTWRANTNFLVWLLIWWQLCWKFS